MIEDFNYRRSAAAKSIDYARTASIREEDLFFDVNDVEYEGHPSEAVHPAVSLRT